MPKYISQEDAENYLSKIGYTLLSKYESSSKPITYRCPNGHEDAKIWGNFCTKPGCNKCNEASMLTYVKSSLEKENYTLLETYSDLRGKTNFKFICPNGHQHRMSWSNFQQGRRCSECSLTGINPLQKANLYYVALKTSEGLLYKIGVTNRPAEERCNSFGIPYKLIKVLEYPVGSDALITEESIIRIYKDFSYKGSVLKNGNKSNGNTECFIKDVLGLDL